jgi:hypothetical protein
MIEELGCGWQIDCGDSKGLCALIEALERNRELVARKSVVAREVFLKHFDRPIATRRIAQILGAGVLKGEAQPIRRGVEHAAAEHEAQ